MANNNANITNNVLNNNNNLPSRSIDPRNITINNAYERRQQSENRGPVIFQQPQQAPQRGLSRNGTAPGPIPAVAGANEPQHGSLFNHSNNINNPSTSVAAPAGPPHPTSATTQNGRTLTPTPSGNIGGYATANVRNWATTNGNMSFGEGANIPPANVAAAGAAPPVTAIRPTLSYQMVVDDDAAVVMGGGSGDDGKGIPLKVFVEERAALRAI